MPAIEAPIQGGGGLAFDATGNLFLSDMAGNLIREVTLDGNIHTIAGTGVSAVSPDGAVALTSPLAAPSSILPDGQGGLYFQEQQTLLPGGLVLRYITPDGHLKTIAGNLQGGFSGDGGLATQAAMGMQNRAGLALDATGNLYVADGFNHRVRVIAPTGLINTFAGNGTSTSMGDGGPVQDAGFSIPARFAVRPARRLVYFRCGCKSHSRGIGRSARDQRCSHSAQFFGTGRWCISAAATAHHRWPGERGGVFDLGKLGRELAGGERGRAYSAIDECAS